MDITPLLTTFGLTALAEFGDKTQLTVIALSAWYDRAKVFTGVILAFTLVTWFGVLVGDGLLRIVPETLIKDYSRSAVCGFWNLDAVIKNELRE